MKIQKIEKHIIIHNNEIDNLCFLSKNLYNYSNFIVRQLKFGILTDIPEEIQPLVKYRYNKYCDKIEYSIPEYTLITCLTSMKQFDYIQLPAKVSQQVIKLLYRNWKSYYASLKEYFIDPKKFKAKPKPPNYKKPKGRNVVIFTNQAARINNNGYIRFPKKTNIKPIKTLIDPIKFQQARIIPNYGHFTIEIVYNAEEEVNPNENLNENNYLSIDLGVNNLIATSNNAGLKPFIINGKVVKSINQYFNKQKAKLQSLLPHKNDNDSKRLQRLHTKRKFKIEYLMHQSSKYIIDYCIDHNIKNIVIGYNQDWKQNVNIGKKNNQKFTYIPYLKLIQMIEYKAFFVGINVIRHEEAYTSKCDALSCESIGKHTNYSGKRIKRGMFKSATNKILNADINGALNILRKVIGDSFINNLNDITPIKVVFNS